ncbi:hypothetical protein DIPPA_02671 [Diplonema papillatum]|nr:hypothetical protein DIPPA_02671 [Diplonema papillatum]
MWLGKRGASQDRLRDTVPFFDEIRPKPVVVVVGRRGQRAVRRVLVHRGRHRGPEFLHMPYALGVNSDDAGCWWDKSRCGVPGMQPRRRTPGRGPGLAGSSLCPRCPKAAPSTVVRRERRLPREPAGPLRIVGSGQKTLGGQVGLEISLGKCGSASGGHHHHKIDFETPSHSSMKSVQNRSLLLSAGAGSARCAGFWYTAAGTAAPEFLHMPYAPGVNSDDAGCCWDKSRCGVPGMKPGNPGGGGCW